MAVASRSFAAAGAAVFVVYACTFPIAAIAGEGGGRVSKPPTTFERRHTPLGMAEAKHALLLPTDLGPSWTSSSSSSAMPSLTCASFHPNLAGIVETGSAQASFGAGSSGPFISQASFAFATNAQAKRFWRRVVGPGTLRCLAGSVQSGSSGGVRFTIVGASVLAAPKLTARTAAYRVIAEAAVTAQKVATYVDMLLLADGRTVTELSFAGFVRPVSAALELRLGRIVATRLGSG